MSNTSLRILVSLVAAPAIAAAIWFGSYWFLLFVVVIALLSFREYSIMSKHTGASFPKVLGYGSLLAFLLNTFFDGIGFFELMGVIIVLLAIIELLYGNGKAIVNLGAAVLGILYLGAATVSLLMLRNDFNDGDPARGAYLVIGFFLSLWSGDSSAYFIGRKFGKHKLNPRVSPNKSWEGAVASYFGSVITMVAVQQLVVVYAIPDFLSIADAVVIGSIVGTVGQFGDLIESLFKREAGIKDSAAIIPGHGGVFDRFDSMMASAPVVLLYVKLVSKVSVF